GRFDHRFRSRLTGEMLDGADDVDVLRRTREEERGGAGLRSGMLDRNVKFVGGKRSAEQSGGPGKARVATRVGGAAEDGARRVVNIQNAAVADVGVIGGNHLGDAADEGAALPADALDDGC